MKNNLAELLCVTYYVLIQYTGSDSMLLNDDLVQRYIGCFLCGIFKKIFICIYVSITYLGVTGASIKLFYNRKVRNEDLRKCQLF